MKQHTLTLEQLERRDLLTMAPCRAGLPIHDDGALVADIDRDGEVGFRDYLRLARSYRDGTDSAGDLNSDGRVDFSDFLTFVRVLHDAKKPRLVVLTDIGGEPDDQQSLVRLLTYANEFSIEALIAGAHLNSEPASSVELIHQTIDAYEAVHSNLRQHDPTYPTADRLRDVVVTGQERAGIFGFDLETAASDCLISIIDANDDRPVNIAIWGGAADLGQALYSVRQTRTPEEVEKFVSKIRVSWIEQDTGVPWIKSNFPGLQGVSHTASENGFLHSPFRGMYLGGDANLSSRAWVLQHVRTHWPYGQLYPEVAAGAEMKEGDTPTWFYFLPSGLSDPDEPSWGGWGGRFEGDGPLYSPAKDTVNGETSGRSTVSRWREDFQNDFAARMEWTTQSWAEANHAPNARINTSTKLTVESGQSVSVSAAGSTDPDGDGLKFEWFQYQEAGTLPYEVSLQGANGPNVSFAAPFVQTEQKIHLILRVKDSGSPPMVDYRRIVITVTPPSSAALAILPLGDSIVQPEHRTRDTSSQKASYRLPLQELLQRDGIAYDFVGSQNQYCGQAPTEFPARAFDPDHEGHWGWRTDEFLNGPDGEYCGGNAGSGSLASWVGSYDRPPDIALVQVGVNDIIAALSDGNHSGVNDLSPREVVEVGQNVQRIVDTLFATVPNPKLRVIVANLTPSSVADEEVQAVNNVIEHLFASSPRVEFVDMYAGFDTGLHTYDGLHPNEAGERLMAKRWYDAIFEG